MTPRVREILNWYGADNPGVLTNMARMFNHGKLAGTGKLVILPVDQGFEHGPARSFAKIQMAMILLIMLNWRLKRVAVLMRRHWVQSKLLLVIMQAKFH